MRTTRTTWLRSLWLRGLAGLLFALVTAAPVAAADRAAEGAGGDRKPAERATARININEATKSELMKLEGVGAGTAERIIAHRQAHGPFRRPQDLGKVEGVGKGILEKNAGRIAVR